MRTLRRRTRRGRGQDAQVSREVARVVTGLPTCPVGALVFGCQRAAGSRSEGAGNASLHNIGVFGRGLGWGNED
jgi:hypothetical protein